MAVYLRNSFTAGEITDQLLGRSDHAAYMKGCRRLINFFVRAHGGIVRRPGTRFVAETKDSTKPSRLIPFEFSVFQTYVLEFGHQYMRVFKDQGQIVSGATPYEIATPFTSGAVAGLKYCQDADRMFLVHLDYPPMELSRTGHTAWTLGTITFGAPIASPGTPSVTIGAGGASYRHAYKITARNEDLIESLPTTAGYTFGPNPPLSSSAYMKISWTGVTGAYDYRVYRDKDNNGVYGYIGTATGLTYTDYGSVTPDVLITPPESVQPFDSSNNYPGTVSFHEQRLCFAGSRNMPQTVWFSKTADPTNLDRSTPYRDDDSIEITLAANQVNVIRWLVSTRALLIGTSGAEWHLSGSDGGTVTPTSILARRETAHGVSDVAPAVWGNVVLFVDRGGKTVRGYVYQLDLDGYAGPDLSIMAEHLTRTYSITAMELQASHGIIWCIRSDGTLLSLTFEKDHEVVAWARHETQGWVESITTIPGADRDELWLIVRRTINGVTTRFVELMDGVYNSDDHEIGQANTTNAYFLDCGLTYDSPFTVTGLATSSPVVVTLSTAHGLVAGDRVRVTDIVGPSSLNGKVYQVASPGTLDFQLKTTSGVTVSGTGLTAWASGGYTRKMVLSLSGYDHLAGEEVAVLADGAVHPNVTITTGGTATLTRRAAVVHVGLPYTSLVEPTPIEIQTQDGQTAQGRIQRITKLGLRFHQSVGGEAGPSETEADTILYRTNLDPMGVAVNATSMDKEITWPAGWGTEGGRIVVQQDQPLPMTLLSLTPRLTVTGK